MWLKQLHYAKYSLWLCHSGVLGIDGWDTTVEESLRNLGHGDPDQTAEAKEAEGWTFEIGSRRGSTLVAVTVGIGGPKSAVRYLAVAAIRSLDESLNLAVATDDLQLHAAEDHPTAIQALRRVEQILRAVDALTSVEER